MWTTGFLIAASLLLFAQDIASTFNQESVATEHAGDRVIVEIEITEKKVYYLYKTHTGFYREDTKSLCQSLNMTMVQFESKAEWLSVSKWIADSEFSSTWFWTGAIRDADTSTWYWEDTGAEIIDFFWCENKPSLGNQLTACLMFNDVFNWHDVECLVYKYQVICEIK